MKRPVFAEATPKLTVLKITSVFILLIMAGACASFPPAPEKTQAPRLEAEAIVSIDGARLGLSRWESENPKAIIIAVHGMNDYAYGFDRAGNWWAAEADITTYGYDQRGFGRSPAPGRWPGNDALIADLRAVIDAVIERHQDLPIYVVGHSMGAGVILASMKEASLPVTGVVLAAPGVWGGSQLPIIYRASVNIAAAIAPGKSLTGERAARQATDNIPVLREMQADPFVVKETRIDAVLGVVRIMGEAYDASDEVGGDILFLLGEKDEIIPVKSMERAADRLCGDVDIRRYEDGWHMLFRDLQAENVWRDIAGWVEQKNAAGRERAEGPAALSCANGS